MGMFINFDRDDFEPDPIDRDRKVENQEPERFTPEGVEGKPKIGKSDIILIDNEYVKGTYYVEAINEKLEPVIRPIKNYSTETSEVYTGTYTKIAEVLGNCDTIK